MASAGGPVTRATTRWMDKWWDADAGLLRNPPGSFEGVVEARSVHLVRETAWYAIGLLRRDGVGDRARAEAALTAVLDHQYDAPGKPWHGTFARFPEWPAPTDGAVEWVDYDPNWRQFVGTALAVAVSDFDNRPKTRSRAVDAIQLAVAAEPPDRVPPTYANIALLRSWLADWSGHPDEAYEAAIVDAFRRHGCFTEYGSPTYYGIDLLALGLWHRAPMASATHARAVELEGALWADIARWWHADLGNLCGPYSRAYGMDLGAYVSGLSLALWCAELPAPFPWMDAEELVHGHDLCMAPLLEHVGVRVPTSVRPEFESFSGPRHVTQVIDDAPRREATGWLEERLMIGAEGGGSRLHARGQFHPATIHWQQPDGALGWLRVEHHGPTRARARSRRLTVECDPHPSAKPVRWVTNAEPLDVTNERWRLPGLAVDLDASAPLLDADALTYEAPTTGPATFDLRLRPTL